MKKRIIFNALAIIMLTTIISSCTKDDEIVADPIGTFTTTLDPGYIVVYSELAADAPWTPAYSFDNIRLLMGMSTSTLNASFRTDCQRVGGLDWAFGIGFQSGELANLGKVDGLGSITEKPSSGYTSMGTIEKGNGYVIRSKKYFINTPEAPYSYYRFFVEDWIVNINGGINGAKIKIQGPF